MLSVAESLYPQSIKPEKIGTSLSSSYKLESDKQYYVAVRVMENPSYVLDVHVIAQTNTGTLINKHGEGAIEKLGYINPDIIKQACWYSLSDGYWYDSETVYIVITRRNKMKKCMVIFLICIFLILTACEVKDDKVNDGESKVLADDFTGDGGYILENNVYDYSSRFETTYEWLEGVNIPIDKPDNVNIKLEQHHLLITDFNSEEFDKYIWNLEEQGLIKQEYSYIDEKNQEFSYIRYLLHKDNLIVIFDKYDSKIRVYITTGNVIKERSQDIQGVKKLLGEEYSEYMFVEISNDTVYEAGYCEFLVIPCEYYDVTDNSATVYYVIADVDKLLLVKKGIWNQVYPMTVNLIKDEKDIELFINYNDVPGSRSGAKVYPGLGKYKLVDGVFKEESVVNLSMNKIIIGKMEAGLLKYYTMRENESYDIENGRRMLWVIDEEYIPE